MTKQEFIQSFEQKEKPSDMMQAIPFLMENINEAKRNGISFFLDEVTTICNILVKDLPPKNRKQVENLIKILN